MNAALHQMPATIAPKPSAKSGAVVGGNAAIGLPIGYDRRRSKRGASKSPTQEDGHEKMNWIIRLTLGVIGFAAAWLVLDFVFLK